MAESSEARDPRLSVFRPREPEGGSEAPAKVDADSGGAGSGADAAKRDPLREAVAAWVASSDGDAPAADADGDADAGADSGADADAGADAAASAGRSGSAPAKGAAAAPADGGRASAPERDGSAADGAAPAAGEPGSASVRDGSAADGAKSAPKGMSGEGAAVAGGAERGSGAAPAAKGTDSASAADKPAADKPAADKPAADEPAADEPAGSERTAVFRAVKSGSGSGSASGEAVSGPAKSGTSAAADTGKPASGAAAASAETSTSGSGSAPAKSEDGSEATGVAKPAAGPGRPAADAAKPASGGASADSERTAVFRAVRPGSGSGSASGGAPADAAKPAAGESADSERTAVFRAVRPGSGSGSASGGATTDAAKPGSGAAPAPAKPAAGESEDSERTAVFRAVRPGSGSGSGSGSASGGAPADAAKPAAGETADSERTAVFRVPKPGSAAPAAGDRPAAFRAVKPGGAAPKDSTFVPLRTDDAEPGQESKPDSKPHVKPPVTAPPAAPRPPADHSERTTQQPLPPRPPLDLLADLTNNPPPPPSPMRTAIRRFKIYTPIAVLLLIILAVVQLVRPLPKPTLVMTAKSSFTFDGGAPQLPWPSEGQAYMAAAGLGTLGQSGEQKPVPIASVTKSMTAYIIMRDHPFKKGEKGAMIDVDKTAESEGQKDKSDNESTLNTVKEGDKISEYDAIAALMIPSANNIARLLARWDSGTQEAFVKKMNDTAKELGMTNTTYTDPSGLDATTVSTAEDQVKLGLKIVEMDAMIDITRKPSWIDPSGKKWDNWNRLVPGNDSLGIKTGTTTKAGGNLLFAAQKKVGNTNQLIVGAVLGQHKAPIIDTVIAASKQLLVATQKSLDGAVVVKKGEVVGYVDDGLGGQAPVVATADVQAVGWASLTVKVKLSDGGGAIPQTAKAGTEVGVLTVGEGASQVKVPVALKGDLVAPTVGSKLTRLG
ncbi:hypothetical protein [Streptomyces sp. NPDC059072]|uniref:D-alanyl-D-alanine carboxypeptidase n=1 Tax=Streptomyces sp. NPDC059072 TaxID=3346715 RepID=UPI0036748927